MEKTFIVEAADTARSVGSGSLYVLSTPTVAARIEETACIVAAPLLAEGETSVGTNITLDHLRRSLPGERITVSVELTGRAGRALSFRAECRNEQNVVVARATHTRFIVDVERFMA